VAFWYRSRRAHEFDDEVESHLNMVVRERIAHGEDPEAARQAALKEFGNVTLVTEATRRVWRGPAAESLTNLWQDVRFTARLLARRPGYAAVVILVLALGIGTNVAAFSLFNAAFVRPLPGVSDPHELVVVVGRGAPDNRIVTVSYPDYTYLRAHHTTLNGLVAMSPAPMSFGIGRNAEKVWGELVSDNYFDVLGVEARLGRTLHAPDDPMAGGDPAVVISDGLWRRSFGADAGIIGRVVQINGRPFTIAGVAEPGFHGTMLGVRNDLFLPLTSMASRASIASTGHRWLILLGRRADGASLDTVASETRVLGEQLAAADPLPEMKGRADVIPLSQSPYGAQTFLLPVVVILGVMGGLVLLVVCANLASLVMARGLDRRGEVAVRLALGASRARILRLLLIENLLLAVTAGGVSLLIARALGGLDASNAKIATMAPSYLDASMDARVVAFALAVACGTSILFGFMPALRTSRVPVGVVLKEEGAAVRGRRTRLRGALVVFQVALSLLLLVVAGLAMRTSRAAQAADVGFDPADAVVVTVDVNLNGYDHARGRRFFDELQDRLRAMPSVESAGLSAFAPLRMVEAESRPVAVDGYAAAPDEDMRLAFNVVSPAYFRTMRIGLIAGREFTKSDGAGGQPVAIVNETMARRFWRTSREAIGRQIVLGNPSDRRTVVGVVRDIKYLNLAESPQPYFYLPLAQEPREEMMIVVRAPIAADRLMAQVRAEVSALDPNLPIVDAQTLAAYARSGTFLYDAVASGLGLFGLLAMSLAGVGIYGLVSYAVRQRRHEIGICMALGASRREVLWRFLRAGLSLGAIGAAIGGAVALVATRLMATVLFGVSATDPVAFGAALSLVLGIAGVASLIPAWRAARLSPASVLQHHH
jgi:putative ABC transport system permease protein